ncbi:primer terminal protein [Bacillus phage vB_BceP_LY3]|uniref:Primer terminal protein n=1 Tax=Bacillus phage vB_BceP_LY3 TaxID=2950458 RepID=A0AAE9LVL3_9CAUD|nr:primer terminal protein [Bacillus phage vB_BceP_LY3]
MGKIILARKRKKKQPKFTIREVDIQNFERLQRNAKAMIRSRKKKYGVDISGEIDLKTNISQFKSRREFNEWKDKMGRLKNRADLQITKTKEGTVASKKQIHESNLEVNRMIKKLKPIEGGKYENKYKVSFTKEKLKELNLQTNVARDMEIKRQEYLESIPRFDKRGKQIKDTRKDKTGGTVIVRQKFDPTLIQNNQRIKIREYNLRQVSDPKRYEEREQQLKMNFERAIREQLDEQGQEILDYVAGMSNAEFNNFYFMFMDSSLNFDFIYQSHEHLQDEQTADETLTGVAERIKTDIQRYDKNREKYQMLIKY